MKSKKERAKICVQYVRDFVFLFWKKPTPPSKKKKNKGITFSYREKISGVMAAGDVTNVVIDSSGLDPGHRANLGFFG